MFITLAYNFALLSAVFLLVSVHIKRVIGHGQYITRPMIRVYIHRTHKFCLPAKMRAYQLVTLLVLQVGYICIDVFITYPRYIWIVGYWVPFCALYVDDLLTTIDKDKWKRRWAAAKNKVQWKWTPNPTPITG